MIPKVIHYCWFGGKSLPNEVKKCINSWKKYCPDYEIKEWNELNYDINKNQFISEAYKNQAWAFVSDFARLDIVYSEGGIYLDTDVELLKNLDVLLDYDCYFAVEQQHRKIATGLGFGAIARHKAVEAMIRQYDNLVYESENKMNFLCPQLNTKALEKFGYIPKEQIQYICDAYIYPPEYFDPIAPGKTNDLLSDQSFSVHHYSANWMSKRVRLKRKLVNFIGQDKINKLKKIKRRSNEK